MKPRSSRKNKRRPKKTRTIKIVQGGSKNISSARLELARAQLIQARLLGTDTRISFNFVDRLLREVLRRRQEEEVLMGEVEDIIQEVEEELLDDACIKCGYSSTAPEEDDDSIIDLDSEDLLPEMEDLELIPSDSADFYPVLPSEELEIDDYSRLEDAARGQRLKRRASKARNWKWPL